MSSLLKEIQEATKSPEASPEERAANSELAPYYDAIERALGLAFVNEFYQKNAQACGVEIDQAFARGFRLGGQLMLEMLSRYSS